MDDCLFADVIDELGAVVGNISVANGYSVTIGTNIKYDVIGSDPRIVYPCAEILFKGINVESDNSNQDQIVVGDFSLRLLRKLTAQHLNTIAVPKAMAELATDIRVAVLSTYRRQQAGTFAQTNFELILPINVAVATLETPADVIVAVSNFSYRIHAGFTER